MSATSTSETGVANRTRQKFEKVRELGMEDGDTFKTSQGYRFVARFKEEMGHINYSYIDGYVANCPVEEVIEDLEEGKIEKVEEGGQR